MPFGGGCLAECSKRCARQIRSQQLFANVQEMHVPLGLRHSLLRTVSHRPNAAARLKHPERRCSSGLTVEDV